MDTTALLSFLGLVALGSYIQTVSGFAIALIITGGATTLDLAPIAFTANVVSLVALANIATAVHRQHSHIDRGIMVPSSVGVLLFSGIGLLLLNHMSQNAVDLLEMLLGVLILGSGMLLTMHPLPLRQTSSATMHFTAGGLGGLFSGMFGAGGPPLVVHLYRQPLPFPVVRTTLLAILGTMPLVRLALEGAAGHVTLDILELGLLSVPVSIVATIAGRRFPPPISELAMRRFAFGLLCIIGLSLIIGNR